MEGVSTIIKNFRPFLLMIFLQFGGAGTYIVIMATLNQGQNRYVLIVYRNAVAALVLAPSRGLPGARRTTAQSARWRAARRSSRARGPAARRRRCDRSRLPALVGFTAFRTGRQVRWR